VDGKAGWVAFGGSDLDSLSPDERHRAKQVLDEYRATKPIARAEVLIYDWAPGRTEVRLENTEDRADALRVADTAIRELRSARDIFADAGRC
jgi:hypothetical protein